ncbi:MAG: hypothetical protein COU33_02145 [Candidatus Magasanikbacteria bacterium CG10_big_fil_rev_8_21_14_0_10_43_6]|uniref:bAvd-like domain-containing protein n=1 Tax=Candidatus Magasanikbacteria bacterium CG10_big_fil_rev_8_21_14_0_10_43_6 TaxID=1974650 RepID=A0A2M6W1D4_9BACT|nr:MAG: hypothetical protein COU33_02145 [Candidatus Magasanikbacteria bacterium CG10_big_fil_rev_8_21_14_0_10_43_6]
METEKPKYILLEKTKSLYTMLQPHLDQFPKTAKFTLRARIENTLLDVIKALITQNYAHTDDERKKYVLEAIANAHLLRVLLQQAIIFRYIPYTHGQEIFGLTNQITAIATARYKNLAGEKNEIPPEQDICEMQAIPTQTNEIPAAKNEAISK